MQEINLQLKYNFIVELRFQSLVKSTYKLTVRFTIVTIYYETIQL